MWLRSGQPIDNPRMLREHRPYSLRPVGDIPWHIACKLLEWYRTTPLPAECMKIQAPPATIAVLPPSRPPDVARQDVVFNPQAPDPATATVRSSPSEAVSSAMIAPEPHGLLGPGSPAAKSRSEAVALYTQAAQSAQPAPKSAGSLLGDMAKYKDDQLLKNPGGDHYDLGKKQAHPEPIGQSSLLGRVGKDLGDAWGNVKNFFQSFLFGRKVLCRGPNDEIREVQQRGLLGSLKDFVLHLGSALTLGVWRPDGEAAPGGFMARLAYAWKKGKQAVLGDLVQGVTGSINRMGKSALLAGWNLVEVIPDATVGSFKAGQKLTTTLFDNGQVVVEYLTDIIPTGEAWMRVHASKWGDLKPPVLYNISSPEYRTDDTRWETVRNTPFRKTIETLGALLADLAVFGLLGRTLMSVHDPNHKRAL